MRYKNPKSQWSQVDSNIENNYLDACFMAAKNDKDFENFRRDSSYGVILEGGSFQIGMERFERLSSSGGLDWLNANLEEFKKNDNFGNPLKWNFEFHESPLSSSVINYANDAFEIANLIGISKIQKIVEIGGGYGGLCRILSSVVSFDQYILIDQPQPLALAKKYLDSYPHLANKISYISSFDKEKIKKLSDIDLFIACNSIAELNEREQEFYNNYIILKSDLSYIVYNTLHIRSSRKIFNKLYRSWQKIFYVAVDDKWFETLHICLFKGKRGFSERYEINNFFDRSHKMIRAKKYYFSTIKYRLFRIQQVLKSIILKK